MYLGLDLGTSGLKGLLIDDNQTIVADTTAPLDVSRPHPSWSEQDPAHWITAAESVFDALAKDHGDKLALVKGIGLSGQQHGATLLDSFDNVLRPCILWNDTRADEEATALDSTPGFREAAGSIIFPGFTAPKLVWVQKNAPEVFEKVAKVLLPKDYLRLWLTGEYASDMSDASGTGWLDVATRDWKADLLTKTDLTLSHMPKAVEGTDVSGTLRPELRDRWNISGSPVVAGGGGDNAASAVGLGTAVDGDTFVSIGTSGVLFAANASFRPMAESAIHTFCHALPGMWHQMGVILSATDGLNWLSGLLKTPAQELTGALGAELKAPGEVTFLPYLSGERTPHNDAAARGAFTGIGHAADRDALTQAVLEGVAFAFKDNLEALKSTGTNPDSVFAVGGGSRSDYWLQAIATALDLPVQCPAKGDFGGAFGAARMGLIAATSATPTEVATKPAVDRTIEPVSDLKLAFDDAYNRFGKTYPALKGART